jgi:hypothetical protein
MGSAPGSDHGTDRDYQGGGKTAALHYFREPLCVGKTDAGEKLLTAKGEKKSREGREGE